MARKIIEDMELVEFSAVDKPAQAPALASITKAADMEKAKTKTEGGQDYPASDFAYVPDPEKPSTWKLRLTSTPGGKPDPQIVGAAAAALGPGFRGNRVEIPAADRAKVVARVRRAWTVANPDKDSADMPEALQKEAKNFDKGLVKGLVKRYIDPADGVVSFAEVVTENMRERAFHEEAEKVSPYLRSLHTSLCSIAGEASIDSATRYTMMRNQIEAFMELARSIFVGVDEVLAPFVEYQKESVMADASEKKEADTATVDGLTKQLEAAQAELKSLKAVAALTADETVYYKSLDGAGQKAFIEKSAEDRAKDLRKAANDETVEIEGRTIRKSVVGEDMFAIMKSQSDRITKAEKETKAEREKREIAEFTKAADEKYSGLPGTSAEKGKALAELSKCSAETQDTIEKMLKASEGARKMAFEDVGENDGTVEKGAGEEVQKASQVFLAKVSEIQASQKLNRMDAMTKARKAYPTEFKAYQEASA